MGLDTLLGMKTDGIPARLGFVIVDKLDTNEMKLKLRNGVIDITLESIQAILDLPKVGFDLNRDEPPKREIDISSTFKQQFPKKPKMCPTDIMELIMKTGDAGQQFKINFLVIVVNILAECSTMCCCKLHFLDKLCNEHDFINKLVSIHLQRVER